MLFILAEHLTVTSEYLAETMQDEEILVDG